MGDLHAVVGWLLRVDAWLLSLTWGAALVGAVFSSYAAWRIWRAMGRLADAGTNGLRSAMLRLHLVTQLGIGLCQMILVAVSWAMATMPALPAAMHEMPQGDLVILVIAGRKIARLLTSLLLLAVSGYKVHWLRRYARY